jgi:acetyltransferase-like isoleucine patch superfamily enzyme
VLQPSDRSPGLLLGEGVELPDDVEIGGNVIVHAGTRIGRGVRIQDGAIVGKPLVLSKTSQAARLDPEPAVLGDGVTVAAGAIVVAGAQIADGAFVGDQAHIRERAVIGADSAIGRGSAVDNDVIIGARVKLQTGCYVTAFSTVEDDVFLGPGVFTFNDNAMGRHEKDERITGPTFRRACRVGGGSLVLPGIEVGEEAFVATGSVVTRDVPPRTLVMGSPARHVRGVEDEELVEQWR